MPIVTKLRQYGQRSRITRQLWRQLHLAPTPPPSRWDGFTTVDDGLRFLAARATTLATQRQENNVLLIGDDAALAQQLQEQLPAELQSQLVSHDQLAQITDKHWLCALCLYPDARRTTQTAHAILQHEILRNISFEYLVLPDTDSAFFKQHDHEKPHTYIAPWLSQGPDFFAIYDESLKHFPEKCALRDYLDLAQCLQTLVANEIPGDIAEFGSYQGHSGYLIAQTLAALGSDKRIYLFDMFDHFPTEPLGIDDFWNATHPVDFASVKAKFSALPNVTLIQGDFTQTFSTSGIEQLALAYVDCDSYRATLALIEQIFPTKLSPGGAMIFEDYGHPALLGNRVAVHDGFAGRKNTLQFYSAFSGFYCVFKR